MTSKNKTQPSAKGLRSRLQSGNAIIMLFAAIGMAGVVTYGLNNVIRGPAVTTAEISRRTMAENNLVATTRLAISAATNQQERGGDCDADGFIEPLPYRAAGGAPAPAGGGLVPATMGASMTDPWGVQYGYCVWDPGTASVSDAVPACGGATPRRLEGAPRDDQYAIAVISAGKNGVFETSCNAYADIAPADGLPDTVLLDKPAGSDDVVLAYTYAEANGIGGGEWKLNALDPTTAEIAKNLEVGSAANPRGATFTEGALTMGGTRGLVLPGDPGDDTVTGACNADKANQLRRNIGDGSAVPVIEICHDNAWVAVSGGTSVGGQCTPAYDTWTARSAAGSRQWYQVAMSSNGETIAAITGYNVTNPVYYSHDGGTTWNTGNVSANFADIAVSANGQTMYAPELYQGMRKSTDGGATWGPRTGPAASYATLDISADGAVVAAVAGGWNIQISTDGGANFVSRGPVMNWYDITVSSNGTRMAAVVDSGYIFNSADSGTTWTQRASSQTWGAITSSSNGMRMAATVVNGRIWTSSDGGDTWVQQMGSPSGDWWEISSSSDGTRLAATMQNGQIYISEDSGVTWAPHQTNRAWNGIAMSANGTKIAAAVNPGNLYTSNGDCPNDGSEEAICGQDWEAHGPSGDTWQGISYGAGKYVATGQNRIMYSIDGANWTTFAPPVSATWIDVVYANGQFVAVATGGTATPVMTSPDGVTWTARTAENNTWTGIAYGNGGYVAVARTGTNRAMTSPDGITWSPQTAAQNNAWQDIAYGNGLFVAVSSNGTNRIMTSPDGVTWTPRAAPAANQWETITYGGGQFVALSINGTNNVMTSSDGINWTSHASGIANEWRGINYGNGQYLAVSGTGTNRVMTSPNGSTWTPYSAAEDNQWDNVFYADGKFVAVALDGTNRTMTSTCSASSSDTITAPRHPLDEDLLAYWKLDEGTGTAVGDSAGGYNGTFVNTPIWAVEGPQGGSSLNFRKADRDAVQINGLLGQPSDGTIAAWVNIESLDTTGGTILGIGDNVSLTATPALGLSLNYWNGASMTSTSSTPTYQGSGWHYVVATFSSIKDTFYVYVDGIVVGSSTSTANVSWSPRGANTFIGRHGNGNTNYDFEGSIDDVRVYGRALSPNEVAALTERARYESLIRDKSYSTLVPEKSGKVSVGGSHACAINKDSSLWCWGDNTGGKLGNTGYPVSASSPVSVMSAPYEWSQVEAGTVTTCGIKTDGTLWCWGQEFNGQFGNGGSDTDSSTTPIAVAPGTVWTQISHTYQHSCGITNTGALYCWGSNVGGKLGIGNTTQQVSITQVGTDKWKFVSAGYLHTCGIKADGSAWCWGSDANGKLGNGTSITADQTSPSRVDGNYFWSSISAKSNEHTCGVTKDGKGLCWGGYSNGKLGNELITSDQASPQFVSGDHLWKEIITETQKTCGVTVNGNVYCWGLDDSGVMGNGTTITWAMNAPYRVALPSPISTLQAGYNTVCAMHEDGRLWCWGSDANGQLGNGATITADQASPSLVARFPNAAAFVWNTANNGLRLTPNMTIALADKWISDDGSARYFGFEGPGVARLAQTTSSNQFMIGNTTATSDSQLSFKKGDPAVAYADSTAGAIFWVMNETTGTTVPSSSANAYPGTITGRAVWNDTGGISTPSLEFDGKTGRVSVANNAAFRPTGSFAITMIIRPDGIQDAGATILSKSYNNGQYDSYALKFTADQKISFITTGTGPVQHTLTSTQSVRPNAWTAVTAFVVDTGGGNITKAIAINNVIEPSSAALAPIYSTDATGNLFFGAGGCLSTCTAFRGGIDAVRVYGIQMTPALFEQIYGFHTTAFSVPKTIGIDQATNSLKIGNNNATSTNWLGSITPDFILNLSGNIGIGTASPAVKVDVNGGMRVGYQTTCNASAVGTLRYTGNTRDVAGSSSSENCLKKMSAGLNHGCAVGNNKKAYCWGLGTSGQLGDGTSASSSQPIAVANGAGPGTYKSVDTSRIEYSGGGALFSCGLATDNRAYCWGDNTYGQLGDNTTTARTSPTLVLNGAGPGTYKYLSVGTFHVCGIGTNDRAYCWGNNTQGELGDNTVSQRNTPVLVLNGAGPGTYKKISTGQDTTCAIGTDDRVYCWGNSGFHQLGWGSTGDSHIPVLTNTGAGPGFYTAISVGEDHVCAVGTDAKAYCWGSGANGMTGNGSVATQQAPALVSNGQSSGTFKDISAGRTHTCAIGTDNKAYCWGDNTYAQVGDGTTSMRTTPRSVLAGESQTTYKEITAGERDSCAIGTDSRLYCWGNNTNSTLADGTTTQRSQPTLALGGFGTNFYDSCPTETSGSYEYCDGTDWKTVGGSLATNGTTWSKRDGGLTTQHASCSIRNDGTLWCWGRDLNGRLGNGTTATDQPSPARVYSTEPWKQVSSGDNHICGIKNNGSAWCWGSDGNGQLGNGAGAANLEVPGSITGTDTWVKISGGFFHTCAIKIDGTAWCWGSDASGQLGNGAPGNAISPSAVTGSSPWVDIEAGVASSCGIKNDGTAWCWGEDANGELGNGATTGQQISPSQVSGTGTWIKVTVGETHACGLKSDGTAWCWGTDTDGELGNDSVTGNQISPSQVSGTGSWIQIDAGHSHTCGVKADGTGWCWGDDTYGQLGNGATTGSQISPSQVSGTGSWLIILAGERTTCGTKTDGTNWCWGSDQYGELGNGSSLTANQISPSPVE